MERNGLSVCAKETNGNASNEGETEAANVQKTKDLDANSSIFAPIFAKIHVKGTSIDEDALHREMNGKTLEVLSLY